MGTGEIVGERALLEPGSVLHADIVAAVVTECYSLGQDDLQDLREKNPEFARVVATIPMLHEIGMPMLSNLDDQSKVVATADQKSNRYASPAQIALCVSDERVNIVFAVR